MKRIVLILIILLIPMIVYAEEITVLDKVKSIVGDADKNSIDVISNTDLAYDGTIDNNLRYVGGDPNNYILFNNELWRIMGIFNNIEVNGEKGSYIKIIRADELGAFSIDNDNDNNDYLTSPLKVLLEGAYLNSEVTTYNNYQSGIIDVDFTTKGIHDDARNDIVNAKWMLGGINNVTLTTSAFYEAENALGAPSFNSKVTFLYASDYGFATSGGENTSRNECLETRLYDWDLTSISDCKDNDYLFTNTYIWLLSQYTGNDWRSLCIFNTGYLINPDSMSKLAVYPTVYLRQDYTINTGDGSRDNPYRYETKTITSNTRSGGKLLFSLRNMNNVPVGDRVSFKVQLDTGYEVDKIDILDSNNELIDYNPTINENEYEFLMPDSDVTINPYYRMVKNGIKVAFSKYGVTNIDIEDNKEVLYGKSVKFKVIPNEGYELSTIEIIDDNGNKIKYKKTINKNEYEFIMPNTGVTIKPLFNNINIIDDNNSKEIINPETSDKLIIVIISIIISLGISIIMKKKRIIN